MVRPHRLIGHLAAIAVSGPSLVALATLAIALNEARAGDAPPHQGSGPSTQPVEPETGGPAAPEPDAELSADPYEDAMQAGSVAFTRGHYSQALGHFDEALKHAPPEQARATIHFNRAACLFELGRFQEAEAAFLTSAELDPGHADNARLNAGFAALRDRRIDAAKKHLESTQSQSDKRRRLAEDIEQSESALAAEATQRMLREAFAQLRRGQTRRAAKSFEQLIRRRAVSKTDEAEAWYGLARALQSHNEYEQAIRAIRQAQRLVPTEGEFQLTLGEIRSRQGKTDAAIAALRRSLAMPLSPDSRAFAERTLARLTRPPWNPGFSGHVLVSAGLDTNADRSGAAESLDAFTGAPPQQSGYSHITFGLGYLFEAGQSLAFGPYYSLSSLLFAAPSVEDLGLTRQAVGPEVYWALSRTVWLRLRLNAGFSFAGLSDPAPFTSELGGGARLNLKQSPDAYLLFDVSANRIFGHAGQAYLDGARVSSRIRQTVYFSRTRFDLSAFGTLNSAGSYQLDVDGQRFDLPQNDDYFFEIPVSYVAAGLELRLRQPFTRRASIEVRGRLTHRPYLEDSLLQSDDGDVVEDSRKRRMDWYLEGGVEAAYALSADRRWSVTADYQLFVSRSNLGGSGSEHRFDYQNRNFTQHSAGVGLMGRF